MSKNKHLKIFFITAGMIVGVGIFLTAKQNVLAAPAENSNINTVNIAQENNALDIAIFGIETVSYVSLTAAGTGGGVGRPGPILSEIRVVNGKNVCRTNNDHPHKSTNGNPPGHIDGECCLDPDETPNSNCYYPQSKYSGMIQKYLKSLKSANKTK